MKPQLANNRLCNGPLWTKSAKANDPDVERCSSQNMLASLKVKLFCLVTKIIHVQYRKLETMEMYKEENESIYNPMNWRYMYMYTYCI